MPKRETKKKQYYDYVTLYGGVLGNYGYIQIKELNLVNGRNFVTYQESIISNVIGSGNLSTGAFGKVYANITNPLINLEVLTGGSIHVGGQRLGNVHIGYQSDVEILGSAVPFFYRQFSDRVRRLHLGESHHDKVAGEYFDVVLLL